MNEHALKCLDSVIACIRAGKVSHAREDKRKEILDAIAIQIRTLTNDITVPFEFLMTLVSTVHSVYAVGRLDGIREMYDSGSSRS